MTKFAFIFPGQGSQEIGMGKALADAFPAAAEVFKEVDEDGNGNMDFAESHRWLLRCTCFLGSSE